MLQHPGLGTPGSGSYSSFQRAPAVPGSASPPETEWSNSQPGRGCSNTDMDRSILVLLRQWLSSLCCCLELLYPGPDPSPHRSHCSDNLLNSAVICTQPGRVPSSPIQSLRRSTAWSAVCCRLMTPAPVIAMYQPAMCNSSNGGGSSCSSSNRL